MPKISIIIPVYNNERYFSNAVESVLQQTFTDWEVIIVDDGSTDNTPNIADAFAKDDKRIKVIHQKNQWIYASFNNGIKEASGEYIYILNSDDIFCNKYCLEHLSKIINQYSPDIIMTNVKIHNLITKEEKNVGLTINEDCFVEGKNAVREKWFKYFKDRLIADQANLYKANIMKKYKFRNDIYGGDFLYNAQIANDILSVAECAHPIYMHIIYDDNTMNASVGKYYNYEHDMRNEFFDEYYNLFLKWNLLDIEKENYLVNKRLSEFTYELKTFLFPVCSLTFEEKLAKAWEWANDLYEFALRYDRHEEFEARTLSGIKNIILLHYGENAGSMQFIVDYLEAILRYEKTDEDMQKIRNAVYNENNENNIGEIFYKRLENTQ